ncbi:hypothetical protein IFR04_004701 [Cadophora malorum]|uniref:DUF1275 domain protein n=1 Tax=Cadophora malorum TaxID=108018 RepID=A0A8H8BRM7_9HELO|nr:hypothetical protein IFR04_004701 [Cadophora malorum]
MSSSRFEYPQESPAAPEDITQELESQQHPVEALVNLEKKSRLKHRLRDFFSENVREDALLETELLLLAFATGIQDATTFPDYQCFASNQTGNTVLLAVGAAGVTGDIFSMRNIGVSLALFVAGSWIMGQIGHLAGCRKRWWLILSSVLQTAMIFAASGIQYRFGVKENEHIIAMGVIALLAFSSGGQVAMARALLMPEITTAMATAAYVDLFLDVNLFGRANRSRDRRVLFLLSLFAGSFAGAFAYSRVGSAFALLISAIGKLVVTVGFVLNKRLEARQDVEMGD